MKIVFYNETLMSGGIEKCIEILIDELYLEDLWYLASFNRKYLISKLSFNKIMSILDEYDVIERRRLIKVLK